MFLVKGKEKHNTLKDRGEEQGKIFRALGT